ncbi:MAG: RIP metalloprotease RseP, partial [Ostreibacterium sp.]
NNNSISKKTTIDLSHLAAGSELDIESALGFRWEIGEAGQNLAAKIKTVETGSPADKAGLRIGDIIISANKTVIPNWRYFVSIITSNPNKTIPITVDRAGATVYLMLTPGQHPKNPALGYAGVSPNINPHLFDKYQSIKQYGLFAALPIAIKENYLQAELTLKILGKMLVGKASIKNVGGPLTIADYSGKTLKMGYVAYFKFLAAISLALAVMNLLPIPVLDGGHMALCLIEMLRGKPLSDHIGHFLLRTGMVIMLTFMAFVLTVDAWKYLVM